MRSTAVAKLSVYSLIVFLGLIGTATVIIGLVRLV